MLGQLITRGGPQSDFYNTKENNKKYSPNVNLYCHLVHICESIVSFY
jgi:hypothetical protein